MKTFLAAATALVLAGSLTACSGSGDDAVASDPAPTTASSVPSSADPSAAAPSAAGPAAPGPVSTRGPVTVIDSGAGPQVCLGPTTRIYPPSCTGPALVGWAFDDTATTEGATTFGTYALTGTWDGSSLTVTSSIPAALYDAAPLETPEAPAAAASLSPAELTAVAEQLATEPGVQGAAPDGEGHVLVDVTYDDGSLQSAADAQHGAGVVLVQSQLVDAS
jgi:hypothetical protein